MAERARVEHAGVPEVGHEHAALDAGDQLGDGRIGDRPVDLAGDVAVVAGRQEAEVAGDRPPPERHVDGVARRSSAPASAADRRSWVSDTVVPRSTSDQALTRRAFLVVPEPDGERVVDER